MPARSESTNLRTSSERSRRVRNTSDYSPKNSFDSINNKINETTSNRLSSNQKKILDSIIRYEKKHPMISGTTGSFSSKYKKLIEERKKRYLKVRAIFRKEVSKKKNDVKILSVLPLLLPQPIIKKIKNKEIIEIQFKTDARKKEFSLLSKDKNGQSSVVVRGNNTFLGHQKPSSSKKIGLSIDVTGKPTIKMHIPGSSSVIEQQSHKNQGEALTEYKKRGVPHSNA